MKVYVINLIVRQEKYYLAELSGTISKSITDAILFSNKNVAYYYATKTENMIDGSLGRVESLALHELI